MTTADEGSKSKLSKARAASSWDDAPEAPAPKEAGEPADAKAEPADDDETPERAPSSAPPPPEPPQRRAAARPWTRYVWTAIAAGFLLFLLVSYLRVDDTIVLDQGVEITSLTLPPQIAPGDTLPMTFTLRTHHALDADDWFFLHVESAGGQDNCRIVFDQLPTGGAPTTWGDGEVKHEVTVPVPADCKPGRLEVYAGLYNRATGDRLKVLKPPTGDNRVHAGFVTVVRSNPDRTLRTITPRQMNLQEYWGLMRPWLGWLSAIFGASVVTAVLARMRRAREQRDIEATDASVVATPLPRAWRWGSLLAPAIPFVLGILVVLEFVKDDAYISFRYAHNLVTGHGLVFNTGEKLEGFTNFLWVMILAPFEALGWDLFQVCEVIGTMLGIALFAQITIATIHLNGERKDLSQTWGAFWIATSSSFVLWAKSGLEQPLAALLPLVGAYLLWTRKSHPGAEVRRLALSGFVMGLACMTRPELHLVVAIVGAPLLIDAIRARKIDKPTLAWVGAVLAITIPFHAFRYAYFGSLVPNTFYVKTGTGSQIWREGIKTLHEMFAFNDLGWLAVLAPLAFLKRTRLVEKLVMTAICLAFMAYIVKVGVDEMQWHRLYLPALPFLVILAACGAQNLLDAVASLVTKQRRELVRVMGAGVGWGAVVIAGYSSFTFTYRELNGFNGHADLAGTFHPDLGKFLVRHERPGALVAFQDMGSTPYHAPDINFLDFIGLVDGTVARARHSHGLHAFIGGDGGSEQLKYDADMREYFYKRSPEWTILTVYTPKGQEQRIAEAFGRDPGEASIGDAFNSNPYQFGLYADARFRQRYVHVRTWQRSIGYYLSLWRRRDLWEQTPREVVLDALPEGVGGVKAKFEGGLEILGSSIDPEVIERHENFITTWWKLPGPMPADTVFFLHVTKAGFQAPGDHTPGDSMWPADRWLPGQILEDRYLFQLPPPGDPKASWMSPGDYQVYIGVWRRSSGQRLRVLEGPNDGQDRVLLGTFHVRSMRPLLDQLIPPTRVDKMRAHPERIIDSKRQPGT